jgi:hypothetical protein
MSTMNLEEKLDEALKETFPASDAFALSPDVPKRPAPNDEDEPAIGQPPVQHRAPREHE